MRPAGRLYAALAFGPAAAVYGVLTDHAAWREDCRALGALVPGPRVLDLGVGPGTSAVEMARAEPGKRHLGLDCSGAMVRRAARAARRAGLDLPLVRGDALALPFRDGALDGATCHSLLYLLPDPAAALAELARALRPGGRRRPPRAARRAAAAGRRARGRAARGRLDAALARDVPAPPPLRRGRARGAARRGRLREARAWPVLGGFGVMAAAARP